MRHAYAAFLVATSLAAVPAIAQQRAPAPVKIAVPKIESGHAIKPSKLPVKETIDAIAKAAEDKGAKVVARVDHAAGAKAVGVDMKPAQLLIFGNPKLGTPLLQSNPRVGLALPLKVLAYEDSAGKVWVTHQTPASIAATFKLKSKSDREAVKAAAAAIDAIMTAAAFAP